ncbi:MAG: 50S ribosomal protein L18 [Candidatus Nealsonbacteria bacterium]|nr:50S ribosomal protein L18 [Candidatus Nealsonbacteria bacterium]
MATKQAKRKIRHKRIRAKITGTSKRPRLAVFRSAGHIYAQLIDDEKGKTLASASDLAIKRGKKSERAKEVGKLIAKVSIEKKIKGVVFDRGGYPYHGRIKALAEGAREGGLNF